MFLDDIALDIITRNFDFDVETSEYFKQQYFEALVDFANQEVISYIDDHDSEKLKQIDSLLLSKDEEKRKKGQRILIDQMQLYVHSYEDLNENIREVAKSYDNRLFYFYIGNGPKEGVLELLKYLSDKLDNFASAKQIISMIEDQDKRVAVEKFFE